MTQILTELTAAYFTSSFSNIISGTFFNLLEVTGIKAETSCHYYKKKKRDFYTAMCMCHQNVLNKL